MNTRFFNILTMLVLIGFSTSIIAGKPDKCPSWPDCGDDPPAEPAPIYKVALTFGTYKFTPVVVTLKKKGKKLSLHSEHGLTIYRDPYPYSTTDELAAWDFVMENCVADGVLWERVESFEVNSSDWSVGKNSENSVHIGMKNIILSGREIQIQLRGVPQDRFPPKNGDTSTFLLDWYIVWGKLLSGGGWDTCQVTGDGIEPLLPDSLLVITAE